MKNGTTRCLHIHVWSRCSLTIGNWTITLLQQVIFILQSTENQKKWQHFKSLKTPKWEHVWMHHLPTLAILEQLQIATIIPWLCETMCSCHMRSWHRRCFVYYKGCQFGMLKQVTKQVNKSNILQSQGSQNPSNGKAQRCVNSLVWYDSLLLQHGFFFE